MDAAEADVRLVESSQSICQRVHKGNISYVTDLRVWVVRFDCSFDFRNWLQNLCEPTRKTQRRFTLTNKIFDFIYNKWQLVRFSFNSKN